MPGRHYGFDRGGVRFLVLDGNDPGGTQGGYNRFIADDQKAWLDIDAGTLSIKGRATEWVGPDPWARGAPEDRYPRDKNRPTISDWTGPISRKS